MGNVFLHGKGGAGGGSNGLVLTIVGGTTRPAKPTQNMIWVNTPHDITNYTFSATQPDISVDGTLWLKIADSGRVKIPSLVGKDWITAYPRCASQYVDNVWMNVDAESYQNGAWCALGTMLLTGSDQHISITGGWGDPLRYYSTDTAYTVGSHSIDESGLTLLCDGRKDLFVGTKSPIHLDGPCEIQFELSGVSIEHQGYCILGVFSNRSAPMSDSVIASFTVASDGKFSLPVNMSAGDYYIGCTNTAYDATNRYTINNIRIV